MTAGPRRSLASGRRAGVLAVSIALLAALLLTLGGSASAIPGCPPFSSYVAPKAAFTWSPNPVVAGQIAEFDASASKPGQHIGPGSFPDCIPEVDGEFPITSYEWEFADGGSGGGEKPSHVYSVAGNYEVTLTVEDEAPASHNLGTIKHAVTVVDTTPPDTLIDTGPTGTITDALPDFTFHSTEAESTFQCSIDTGSPAFAPCSGPGQDQPASPLTPGSYTFRVRAADKYGNIDPSPATRAFTVASPPSGGAGSSSSKSGPPDTLLSAHPKSSVKTHKRASVRFVFSSNPTGATFECRMDRGAFSACSSPKTYKLKPGLHSFSVRAVAGGVEDPTPAGFSFRVVRKTSR